MMETLGVEHCTVGGIASKAQRLLWTSSGFLEGADYHFYSALSRAAYCDGASSDERQQHLESLAAHHRQLAVWAENCPENFENRVALMGAEIARLEGRVVDAGDLYEKAIRSARANDFVHNEAIANETAARFYEARGFETISDAYLRKAFSCYMRWGATGKVGQLGELYPQLREHIARKQVRRRPPAGLVLIVDIRECLRVSVLHDVAGARCPRWSRAAGSGE
jgi:hypothetical protein